MNSRTAGTVFAVACLVGLAAWWLLASDETSPADVELVEMPAAERVVADAETIEARPREPVAAPARGDPIDEAMVDSAPPPATFAVTVLHGDGDPAAGVIAVLTQDGKFVERTVTSPQGVAEFAADDGAGVVYVGGGTLAIEQLEVAACTGAAELRLSLGERSVRGVVRLGGAPASIPLGLRPTPRSSVVPWDIQQQLGLATTGLARSHVDRGQHTGVDGTFRFTALPVDWKGQFAFGLAYALADNSDGWARPDVPNSSDLVVLELRSVPVIHGRVVEADGTTPAVGARVEGKLDHRSSGIGDTWFTDELGEFAIPMADGPVDKFAAVITGAQGNARAAIEVADVSDEIDHDLGTIVLRELRTLTFEVTNEAGEPVVGARIVAPSGARSEPADATGAAVVTVPSGRMLAGVEVWAHAYARHVLDVPTPLPQTPVPVTLTPCATLDVTVEGDASGCSAHLVVEGGRSAQIGRDAMRQLVIREATGIPESALRSTGSNRTSTGTVLRYNVDLTDSRAVFSCLPSAPMTVSIHDRFGSVVWTTRITLDSGEQRSVVAQVPESATIVGRLLDVDGRPVAGATVNLKPSPAGGKRISRFELPKPDATSDADGRFTIDDVRAPTITAVVEAPGFVRTQLVDVPRPTGEWLVTLERGRDVEAVFVDADGNPEPIARLSAFEGEARLSVAIERSPSEEPLENAAAGRASESRWILRDLPPRNVRLVASRGNGSDIEAVLPASDERVVIEVAATGTLQVSFDAPHTLVDLSLQIDGEKHPRRIDADDIGRATLGAVAVGARSLTLQQRPHDDRNAPWTPLATTTVEVSPGGVHDVEF